MPINPIVLQRRHAELGRIRLGNQVAVGDSGRTRPNKLNKFRFTSPSESYIRELAGLYGGEARPWKNGSKDEWEVYSDAKSIPVIVIKGGLSQWMEYWSGGGCIHRCDGITNVLTDSPCDLTEKVKVRVRGQDTFVNPHAEAKPTTRVSMMLPDLDAIGALRLETHGWNAAAEIPAVAELAQFVGDLVPAVLHLVERTSVKDGKTSQFVVPVLDLKIGTAKLRELVAQKMGEPLALAGGHADGPAAIAAPAPDYLAQAQDCSTLPAVQAIWHKANNAGHMTAELNAQLKVVGDALANAAAAPPGPDADGAYEAEIVTQDQEAAAAAADAAWQRVLAEAGRQGMGEQDVLGGFAEFAGGVQAIDAPAAQLDAYLQHLQGVAA
jgi:hypothetical protein